MHPSIKFDVVWRIFIQNWYKGLKEQELTDSNSFPYTPIAPYRSVKLKLFFSPCLPCPPCPPASLPPLPLLNSVVVLGKFQDLINKKFNILGPLLNKYV
jgi:hypothetical protein